MNSPAPIPLKYQPLDPQKLFHGILSASTHAWQALRYWGLRGAWNVWRGTVGSLVRNRLRTAEERSGSQQPQVTLLVISIYPDLIQTWYYFATHFVDAQRVKLLIVDSCGLIDPKLFPAARVVRFCNFSHARKIDYFIRHEIDTPYVWLSDDDSLIIRANTLDLAYHQLTTASKMAAVSLQPRGWSFDLNGHAHTAMGVYNLLFSRAIFINENLSFSPVRSNTKVGRGTGYYDTGDYANEQLLLRGYQIETIDDIENLYVKSFVGVSSGMLKVLNVPDAYTMLEAEVKSNPNVASYHLVGLYCDWKIIGLYRQIFASEPRWLPPLSAPQIHQLLATLPAEFFEKASDLVATHEAKFQFLSQLAAQF